MAETQYIERAVLQVNGVDLDDIINSIDEDGDRPTKAVHTMNKRRVARGFKQSNNQYKLEIDAERIVDSRIPDWHGMKDAGTRFKISIRYNIGKPVTYEGCVVTSVKEKTADGDSTQRISVMARIRR